RFSHRHGFRVARDETRAVGCRVFGSYTITASALRATRRTLSGAVMGSTETVTTLHPTGERR
ncbi:hypothetical protein, partial [Halogranum rubrum]|uniref:hypothetical protein n=1 Tax=Halogranum rubrum TaxID=553466 RepID=UPI001ED8EE43